MKKETLLLYLGIVSYFLAIAEHLLNLGILEATYSTLGKANVVYILVILGTALIVTYFIANKRRKGNIDIAFSVRSRPSWAQPPNDYYDGDDYGVRWHLYKPSVIARDSRPWADGPYCPKCKRELEEERAGKISKRLIWICPICGEVFERPQGNVKEFVEKNFAAYLRRKGEL